ncbi:MAG: acyltransferase [Candidatus Bathyarchaeia archaeon]
MIISKTMMRFFGMYAPSQSMRIAMYRKAGIKIGKVHTFGSNIYLDIFSPYNTVIGDNINLAGYAHIITHSNILWGIEDEGGPVVIKNGARIGINVTILPGVTIGENAVIGACSLVNKDIPDNCIAVGVPAKPVKLHHFYNNELYRKLTPSDMVRNVEKIKGE